MKKALFILFVFLSIKSVGQSPSIIPLKADSIIISKTGGSAELVIRNSTKNVLGYLYNRGDGVTEFRAASGTASVITTVAGLRLITSPDANTVYETTDYGTGNWYYDPTDITSTDNTGTILVAGTKRYKRIYTGSINARWFGSVSLAVTAIGSDSGTIVVSSPISLSANLTIPSNVSLVIIKGGAINTGIRTLAINGAFKAERYKVFSGTGAITFGSGSIDYQFPEWDGAKNDGTDSVAGTRAFAIQVARFVPIELGIGTYLVDSIRTLTSHPLVIVGQPQMFHSTIQASSTSVPFIVIGDSASVEHTYLSNFAINGNVLSAGGIILGGDIGGTLPSGQIRGYTAYTTIDNVYISNFSSTGAFGIQLKRVQECDINVRFNNNYNAIYRPNLGYCTTTHIKGSICYLGRSLNRGASLEGRCDDILFDGATIESNINEGIYYNATNGAGTIRIENCYFEENSSGGTGTISITGRAGANRVSVIINNNSFHANHTPDTKMLFLDSVIHSVVRNNYGLMQFQDSGIVTGDQAQVHFEGNNSFDNFTTAYFSRYKWLRGNISVDDIAANLSRYNIGRTFYGGTAYTDTLVLKPHTNYLNPDRGMYLYGTKILFGSNYIDDSLNTFVMPTTGSSMGIGVSSAPSIPVKFAVGGGDVIIDNNAAYRSYLSDGVTKKVLLRETDADITELHGGSSGIGFMSNANAQVAKLTIGGNLGIQLLVDPTARVEIKPGSAPAGNSPFKIGFGAKLTVPEPGAIEVDSVDNQIEWTDKNGIRKFLGSGTVTSVAALTLGTTGTDLSSSVANSTTTPVITLNVPTASASNRGALSATDWSTFNGKQNTITTLPIVNGGTNNGSLSVTAGTIYYGDGTKLVGLAPGTSSQILHGGTVPSFKDTTAAGGGSFSRQVITTGSSGTVSGGNYIVTFNPSSTLASYSLTLPASPSDMNVVEIEFGGTLTSGSIVTTLTILANSGQTIIDNTPPASATADNYLKYRYRTASAQWYRIKL